MILDDIVGIKKKDLEIRKSKIPMETIMDKLGKLSKLNEKNFKNAILKTELSIIGEIKKASPSKGVISLDFHPGDIARIYEKLDINAISVLTETHYFKGSDEYLKLVKSIVSKPVLRKDFIIDEYQIYESKFIGADAILLITRILGKKLKEFYRIACDLNLQCIVEVHNKEELHIALDIEPEIIGINNRNLENFTIDLRNTERLVKYVPDSIALISESGIKTIEDFKYIRSLPVNAVLIGEGFMKKVDNSKNISEFIDNLKRR